MKISTLAFRDGKYVMPNRVLMAEGASVRRYDGQKLDELRLDAEIRTVADINGLISFLEAHKACFTTNEEK